MTARRIERPAAELAAGKATARSGGATINDIARLAGVSKKTVSRVINHSPLVQKDTRERVEALIREVGYVPDPMARGLAFRKSFLIGMVYDNPNAQYIVNMQGGVLERLRGSGYELVVHPTDSTSPDYVEGVRHFVMQQRLHGVILVPRVSEDAALVEMLTQAGVRYSRIAAVPLEAPRRMVVTNDRLGAIEVANYLADLGHRRIALVTGPQRYLSARERGGGFLSALGERGIALAPECIVESGYTFESGVEAAEHLLALDERPTAVFALNDEMAAGIYAVAHRLGISIPGELSVIGFDDSPLATRLWPSLSSVRLPIHEMGLDAAALLLAAEDDPVEGPQFAPHLVIRQSAATPR